MKFITSINGTVALHVSGDDVMPTRGIFPQDLINFIGSAYNFSVRPQLTPALAPFAQPLVFQSGILTTANDKLPIIQLASVINGDMITAATTEIADLILDDYIARLDSELGYRFSSAKQR